MKKFLAVGAALLFPVCAFAQSGVPQPAKPQAANAAPQSQTPSIVRFPVNVVLVPVTVKDSTGALVPDLVQADFRIFQDGKEQQVKNFWDQAFPMSVVVLLDDNLPTSESQNVLKSLDSIAAGFSAADEVALVRFDEYPKTVLDFTSNNDALFAKLKEIRTDSKDALDSRVPGSPSSTIMSPPVINGHTLGGAADIPILGTSNNGVTKHLDDAVHYAAEMLSNRSKDRRKIIFIVSDGTNDRHNTWSVNNNLQLMFSKNISVYAISVDSFADTLMLRGKGRLGQYANPTGGDVLSGDNPKQIEVLYSRLMEEARDQYTLGYYPTKTVGRGNCHALEVRVERPGLAVTARQGYCAELAR
jgi:VWFA-related protein